MAKKEKKQGRVGTIIGIVLCLLLVPILVINVTIIIKGLVNPNKVPSVGGYSPLIVLTPSMDAKPDPVIKAGDLIFIKQIDVQDVKEGDVIAFFDPQSQSNGVLTHRVKEITTDDEGKPAFVTQGDANNAEDPAKAPFDNFVGIYKGKIPGAGNVAMFLQSTPGLIVCIAIPLVLLVAFELIRRKKYEKAKNKDTEALLEELEALKAKQAAAEKAKETVEKKIPDAPSGEDLSEAVDKVEEAVENVESETKDGEN